MSDSTLWVVLELTSKAEGEDPDIVRASIIHHIRDAEVFIPASVVERGSVREYQYLVDGYAFIRYKHNDNIYSRLEDTKYVQGALKFPTGFKKEKKLSTVTEAQINKLRSQIVVEVEQGIEVGDRVMITSGPYKNISAEVKEEIPEQDSVMVYVRLRSTDRLLTLPRAFLKLESKSPISSYRERFGSLDRWIQSTLAVTSLRTDEVKACDAHYKNLQKLMQASKLETSLQGVLDLPSLTPLRQQHKQHQLLAKGTRALQRVVVAGTPTPSVYNVLDKHREYETLASLCNRFRTAYEEMDRMQPKNMNTLNLVIDGTQLMIRCGEAPGLNTLTDTQGRPTGAVVGFLRALGSYRKRFPNAKITVCWDGSSQRRKQLFPDYKGTRPSRSGATPFFGWDWMRELLPLLGVSQAFNPQEEADDVMASLVRGPMANQANVMVTTDRDLLQVVSDSTYQLSPAVGAGKEKLYDPALVQLEYGVPPSSMVQLRSLSGDNSDNIPGVPGFGVKTASKVLGTYGTVQVLLGSNLAGIGKIQAANLRNHTKQILLNLEVMALKDVSFVEVKPCCDFTRAAEMMSQIDMKADPIVTVFK